MPRQTIREARRSSRLESEEQPELDTIGESPHKRKSIMITDDIRRKYRAYAMKADRPLDIQKWADIQYGTPVEEE